jgi:biotin operon repressor
MFWLFSGKRDVEKLKEDTKKGFESVKKDILGVGGWIKHLDSEREIQKRDFEDIKEELSSVREELENVKNILEMIGNQNVKQVFKTPKQLFNKQTAVYPVQTVVQTVVQTPNLDQFSVSERAILWVLLNSDMKLSYDDLAAVLGKERATIRGQINAIKQKSEGIIEEISERNGKKRVFIPEDVKEKLLKKAKVRVKKGIRDKKPKKD